MNQNCEQFFDAISNYSVEENVYSFVESVTVGLRPSKAGDAAVYIMKIRSTIRNEGRASETLDMICEFADDSAVTLFLEVKLFLGVEEDDGLSAQELADWYHSRGFRGDRTEMIREPKHRQ